jgi:hypothetical protein
MASFKPAMFSASGEFGISRRNSQDSPARNLYDGSPNTTIRKIMHKFAAAIVGGVLACNVAIAAEPVTQVMIIGTFHFGNPGRDLGNAKAVDVLTPQRQAELQALAASLARFAPTAVAVEWSKDLADTRYAAYKAGATADRNEVEQIGFRLAAMRKLDKVFGVDVEGEFPYGKMASWAEKNEMGARLAATRKDIDAIVGDISERQKTHTLGDVLKHINSAEYLKASNFFYGDAMRYGNGDEQPGAELNAAWAKRNYLICGRIVQALKPGDRAVVVYGFGHIRLLQQCIADVPGMEVVDPTPYFPR